MEEEEEEMGRLDDFQRNARNTQARFVGASRQICIEMDNDVPTLVSSFLAPVVYTESRA